MGISAFVCVLFVLCSFGDVNGYGYDTRAGIVEGKLNVHLVPHSHDDVGWLKTVDQYYVGSNNSIQGACVENTLDSVFDSLRRDPNRKFVFAEMCISECAEKAQKNGGWCMHDEASTHYIDMIDQTTLGHLAIKSQFNKTPRAGWQIDPFGHSAVQAYLLGAELGFDSVHFARIDYQDRAKRKADKSLEVVWRGSKTFGSSSQIFANAFPVHYSPPTGFHFEVFDDIVPVQDNPLIFDYNVQERVNDFINAAITQANITRTNHVMWTMGDDFQYQYAESWFKQMDKLIHYVNKDGRVNALYSTPSMYTDVKNAANLAWPLKTDDYFPYADRANAYWTGYFTSRPALKGYIRMLSGYYMAARQLEFLVGRRSAGPHTFSLGDALGIGQHHDAITGTAKQHTTNDYGERLAIGATECQLLNISYCPPTEEDIPAGKSLVVVAYNSLGWIRTDIIKIPVQDANLIVQDSAGNKIETQFVALDNVTNNLRNFYTKAYVGISPKDSPKYWLLFQATVPPLGWNTYFVSKVTGAGGKVTRGKRRERYMSATDAPQNDTVEIGPGSLKMSFSLTSGQLSRFSNSKTGADIPVQQSYLWYGSSDGGTDSQPSGAYIFRPNGSPPVITSRSVPLKIIRGPLVDEVHQQFSPWIYQVIRLYKDKDHAEFEFTVGPIPTDDDIGKEVITRITANMVTEKVFYTDSNGRDFLKRVRDYREDWNLSVNQPVAGNYYPVNLGIFTTDKKSELSILVDRAIGGGSIKDGQLELMLHRRTIYDDSRGVGEPLDEIVCVEGTCEGLTVRGNYYMSVNQLGAGSRWRRVTGQEIYSPLLLAFTHEAGEDANYSTLAKVELKKMFAGKTITMIKETSLSANQDKSAMKTMAWKVEGDNGGAPAPMKGGPVNASTLIVELGPMEIRTFLLKF
ncbi:hypothetical protein LguiA_013955 [Lonicera macranthoides]